MAKEKSKVEFTRVNINLPNNLISRVKKYGDSLGINTTSAYIILLNNALDEKDTLTKIPEVIAVMNELKTMENNKNNLDN
jgi:hypothetical protein